MQSDNSLIMLAQLFVAVLSFNVIYNILLSFGSVSTRTPDFSSLSQWAFIYNLTTAAVYEEIMSRLLTIVLIVFSAVTFGLAHAPGWDYWKVLPTLISGFALGYLFVRKGIFLAILLHFSINFMSIFLSLLNDNFMPAFIITIVFYYWIGSGI